LDPNTKLDNLKELVTADIIPTFPTMPVASELGHVIFERLSNVFLTGPF
jgi:hypothetical protein